MERSRALCLAVAAVTVGAGVLRAHDLFMRPDAFFVAANSTVAIPVLNGTFSTSENAVARDRLADLSLAGPFGRRQIPAGQWTDVDPRSTVTVRTEHDGTYVVGAAIKPRLLELPGAEFNAYLKEEGIDQILESRRAAGILDQPSREKYAKFPKALLQVGAGRTDTYATALGYEAEIVPLANPYALQVGETLAVRCLVLGKPLAAYVVFAGGRREDGTTRLPVQRVKTDAAGVARFKVSAAGAWYVKFVHMQAVNAPDANYESRWATLTFGVRARRP
jgi:uncharacterized GH25 family protein